MEVLDTFKEALALRPQEEVVVFLTGEEGIHQDYTSWGRVTAVTVSGIKLWLPEEAVALHLSQEDFRQGTVTLFQALEETKFA